MFIDMLRGTTKGGKRGIISTSEQLFTKSLTKSKTHTSSDWQSAGSSSTTMGPYDLRNVIKMTSSAAKRTSSGDWQSSSASMSWKDANGTVITGLVGSNIYVPQFADNYDLSACSAVCTISGKTRNLWEADSGYKYMVIGGTFTVTIWTPTPGIIYQDYLKQK